MNLKEFQKLPIGTILMYGGYFNRHIILVEAKIDKNRTIIVDVAWKEDLGRDGELFDYSKDKQFTLLEQVRIAPRWIRKLYEVKNE